jgi:hypothetical protein
VPVATPRRPDEAARDGRAARDRRARALRRCRAPVHTLLAYLLLADGRPLSAAGLARQVYPASTRATSSLQVLVAKLRGAGIDIRPVGAAAGRAACGKPSRCPVGYRLVGALPDHLLPTVLDACHRLKPRIVDASPKAVEAWLARAAVEAAPAGAYWDASERRVRLAPDAAKRRSAERPPLRAPVPV